MADIPGLIEGAHKGAGIGHRFLGHVERCRVLLHLIDASSYDPVKSWQIVRREVEAYADILADKPEVLVLSKCDTAPMTILMRCAMHCRQPGQAPFFICHLSVMMALPLFCEL